MSGTWIYICIIQFDIFTFEDIVIVLKVKYITVVVLRDIQVSIRIATVQVFYNILRIFQFLVFISEIIFLLKFYMLSLS